jgi:hypothetical protein
VAADITFAWLFGDWIFEEEDPLTGRRRR